MPLKRKKRAPRKKVVKKRSTVPRGLRQGIIPIQRDVTYFVNSDYGALPTNWAFGTAGSHYNTIQATQVFNLGMLENSSEFTNLFKHYKLNCVIVTITMLHNTSSFTAGSSQNYYGGNLIVYATKNSQGLPLDTAIEQGYWDQISAKKTITMTGMKPKVFKIYPKILKEAYLTASTSQTVSEKSGWLPTSSVGMDVPHYGLNMQFSYTDPNLAFKKVGVAGSVAPLNFRVNYKFLMQFKGIH